MCAQLLKPFGQRSRRSWQNPLVTQGSYFASHFIMGGEKFDSTHPEGYLFGENSDLNFLGNRPVVFPYAAPPPQEPVKTLRSLVNIRKDTLRLVKCSEEVKAPGEDLSKAKISYNVEFTFDTDARVAITIYYQATEDFQNGVASYVPRDRSLQSETVHYKRGVCQQFCLPSHTVDPSEWLEEELGFDLDKEVYPMVVHAVVDEGDGHTGQSHVLLATFEKHMDASICVKPLKQKQVVDGVSYLLQEIYGIENKYNTKDSKIAEDEVSDNSAECVVCLSDVRDTLILPCRHLCLCNTCADTLRYQANNCPICRLPFRALLQIRAMRKKTDPLSPTSFNPLITSQTSDSEEHSASDHVPAGYEVVSLLEALNGPLTPSPSSAPPLRVPGMLPSYGSDGDLPPIRTHSAMDRLSDCSSQGFKLKKSLSKSISQNSSVLHEEEDEKTCSELDMRISRRKSPRPGEECGITPESENLTLSSSGAIGHSSCTGTPLSSTITSPEDPVSSSLAQSVMSMASSQSQHSQLSTDTMSSMSGSYIAVGTEEDGDILPSPSAAASSPPSEEAELTPVELPDRNFVPAEELDAEGNDVLDDENRLPIQEDGQRTGDFLGTECDNNNDTGLAPGNMLDNSLCYEACLAGLCCIFHRGLPSRRRGSIQACESMKAPNTGELQLQLFTLKPVKCLHTGHTSFSRGFSFLVWKWSQKKLMLARWGSTYIGTAHITSDVDNLNTELTDATYWHNEVLLMNGNVWRVFEVVQPGDNSVSSCRTNTQRRFSLSMTCIALEDENCMPQPLDV